MDKEAKEEGKKHWQKEKETNGTSAQNDTKGKDTKGEKCTFDNFASIREVKFSGLHLLEGETRATHHQQLARDQKKKQDSEKHANLSSNVDHASMPVQEFENAMLRGKREEA